MIARILKCLLATSIFLATVGVFSLCAQEKPESCKTMEYEHRNMIDYGPLRISRIHGITKDAHGMALGSGCVGVFSKDGKRLISATNIRSDGTFDIPKIAKGDYILVVKIDLLCPANAKVKLGSGIRSKSNLIAVIKPSGLDECSWIEAK